MEQLFEQFQNIIRDTETGYKRYLFGSIDWSNRLIAVTGARGSGKTTLMLQYIKEQMPADETVLYISLDHIYFTEHTLLSLVDRFVKNNGQFLFIDEVHKYPNWSLELKNIYDTYKKLKIVFTGSSVLEIHKAQGDLSRRAVIYELAGLSFREFLQFEKHKSFAPVTLDDLLKKHIQIANDISSGLKPLPAFNHYLQYGYYPYYLENKNQYPQKLLNTINLTLEVDLLSVQHIDYSSVQKLKKLLYVLGQSVPFKPNISKLAERIGTTRPSLLMYLSYLEKTKLIHQLKEPGKGLSVLTKAEKIYSGNPNIMYAITNQKPEKGTLREAFFFNQLSVLHQVNSTVNGDFVVDNKLTFEIGGKGKDYTQIANIKNSYLALDDIETGMNNKIPLWLFGFLY